MLNQFKFIHQGSNLNRRRCSHQVLSGRSPEKVSLLLHIQLIFIRDTCLQIQVTWSCVISRRGWGLTQLLGHCVIFLTTCCNFVMRRGRGLTQLRRKDRGFGFLAEVGGVIARVIRPDCGLPLNDLRADLATYLTRFSVICK